MERHPFLSQQRMLPSLIGLLATMLVIASIFGCGRRLRHGLEGLSGLVFVVEL